ncbi:MAG TPA: ABC transporter permease [Candidatus Krumholzibacteria bacterium]|nr:ABC transporter permease [Candidatus Krumholzibacteria bacterium]
MSRGLGVSSDIFAMSTRAIVGNKLRSSLTLLGIVAGIASIIAVMTAISVMQAAMEKEMSILGTQVFQVQKFPAGFASDRDRRKAMKRPPLTIENANAIREQVPSVDIVGCELWDFGYKAEYNGVSTNPNLSICGGTPEYSDNNTQYISTGRNLSPIDIKAGRQVVIIGYDIAKKLFPFTDPIGKMMRLDGHKYEVIGVFDQKKSAFGSGYDNYCLIPISTFQNIYGMMTRDGFRRSVNITVHAKTPQLVQEAMDETTQVMRHERGLRAGQDNNFDFFSSESLITQFRKLTAKIKLAAFVIGTIALVVAGIGIMNIMLVSVTERTKEIGIRKSLGANPTHILLQFLLEAVILCNIGGVIGILVGFGLGNVVTIFTHFAAHVPAQWAVIGLIFCSAVGIGFGMLPAIRASRLNPIDALRYE